MRIAVVAIAGRVHGIGGMQDHTHELARGLVRAGHEVEVITARHPEGLREAWVEGARWRFIDAKGHQLDPGWHESSHEEFLRAEAERPFDVIHSESTSALGLVRHGVHRRVPLVVKFHGNFISITKGIARRMLAARAPRPLLREVKGFVWLCSREHFPRGNWYRFRPCEAIVPSRLQLDDTCRSHLLKRSQMHVVPNGVDVALFRPRSREEVRLELGLGPEPLLACVGRLTREKGVQYAIRALARLEERDVRARLVVVGDGPERESLQRLSASLGVAERACFVGAQAPDRVAAYLAAADVFLFPTRYAEAAPLVLPQAMACASPVVASSIGAIPEVIDRPGENGFLVPPGDEAALAEATATLLRDADLRRRLGVAARRRILDEYTLEAMIDRTVEVYRVAQARLGATRSSSSIFPRDGTRSSA